MDWTYELLAEHERRLLQRAGTFSSGFTLDLFEAVNGSDSDLDVLNGLEALVERGLIRREQTSGRRRFRLLRVIEEYAAEKLGKSDEAMDARRRHAVALRNLVEAAEAELVGQDGAEWLTQLRDEEDNLRAAMNFCTRSGDHETAVHIAAAMWRFWQLQGRFSEGRRWLTELMAAGEGRISGRAHAKALSSLGNLLYWQNQFTEAERCYAESLAHYRDLGDSGGAAEQLYNLAYITLVWNDHVAASNLYEESRGLFLEAHDARGVAKATMGAAVAASFGADLAVAGARVEDAMKLCRETRDRYAETTGMWVEYRIPRAEDRLGDAAEAARSGLAQASEASDLPGVAAGLDYLASVAIAEGATRRAVRLAGAAAAIRDVAGGGAAKRLMDIPEGDIRQAAAEHLDEDQLDAEWRAGSAVAPEDAVRYALTVESGDHSPLAILARSREGANRKPFRGDRGSCMAAMSAPRTSFK